MPEIVWAPPIVVMLQKTNIPAPQGTFEISAAAGINTPAIIENLGPHPAVITNTGNTVFKTVTLQDNLAAAFVVFVGAGTITGDGAKVRITIGSPFFR